MRRVIAVDPGLASFGLVSIQTDGLDHFCDRVDVFESVPLSRKLNTEIADDNIRRARELQAWLSAHLDADPSVVAAEAMSFPRDQHAVVMIALSWGILVGELERRRIPLVCAAPTRWRGYLIGYASPRRLTVQEREDLSHVEAVRRIPSFVPAARMIPRKLQEHALDALGVFAWSVSTNLVRAAVRR